ENVEGAQFGHAFFKAVLGLAALTQLLAVGDEGAAARPAGTIGQPLGLTIMALGLEPMVAQGTHDRGDVRNRLAGPGIGPAPDGAFLSLGPVALHGEPRSCWGTSRQVDGPPWTAAASLRYIRVGLVRKRFGAAHLFGKRSSVAPEDTVVADWQSAVLGR